MVADWFCRYNAFAISRTLSCVIGQPQTTLPQLWVYNRFRLCRLFLFVPKSISGAICGGNYIIFNTSTDLYRLYGFYYWGFLLLGIWESLEKIASLTGRTAGKKALQWLIVGYISFMAPMGLVYLFVPITRNAVASIMCGFALALALILAFKVVPVYNRTHGPA